MTAAMEANNWCLAQLRPNQLDRARINLERQGYPSFMPYRRTTKRRGQKMVQILGPLFPGYLFVHVDPDQTWREINSTYGVSRLVMRAANTPQPVPPALMDELIAQTDDKGVLTPKEQLSPGDRVRIIAGPMADLVAQVAHLSEQERVGVLLELMGQAVRADLPRAHVSRLSD